MKKQNLKEKLRRSLGLSLAAVGVLALLSSACTKSRDAEIKDGELKSEIFEISALENREGDVSTEGSAVAAAPEAKINVLDEKPSVKIESSSFPENLQKIFKGLIIKADAGSNMKIKLAVRLQSGEGSAMHILRVVDDESKLTQLEKQTIMVLGKDKKKVIPLFKVGVSDFGQLCREKDANGDETSNLKLCHTDIGAATHVQLAINKNNRKPYIPSTALEEIFLSEGLDGKVSTMASLKEKLNVSLTPADGTKVVSYVSPTNGSAADILIYKIMKKSNLTPKLLDMLNSDLSILKGRVSYCSKELLIQLSAEDQRDCVIVYAFAIPATTVEAQIKTEDGMAEPTIDISFKDAEAGSKSTLLKIKAKTAIEIVPVNQIETLTSANTIRIENIRGKEFLLRRTFEEGASSIQVFGPGASGELDIVTFEMEDKRLVVRRATTLNGTSGKDSIDREELMSIPVRYMGVDPNSIGLNPDLIDTNKDTAQYLILDWTKNTVPAINSPLAYFQDGQCFNGTGNQEITDLDNRIQDGVLNFSISGSYSFTPECMSWYGLKDYWYGGGLQGVFNIKERVSFKLHDQALDKKALELPFQAQTLMNFGVFTTGKMKPDEFGNHGQIGTEESRPVIHDFSGGKTLTYHLGGLPAKGWMREQLIAGTREVIAEWNEGLHLAFKGTELERSGDYVLLKIDTVDSEPGRLGDLDRNYIWNFEKNLDSGLLGMSQAGPNPRSGRIEQNNVLMYSGNLLSSIGSVRETVRIQKEYADLKAKILAQAHAGEVKAPADDLSTPAIDPNDPNAGLTFENGRRIRSASQQLLGKINALASAQAPRTPMALKASSASTIKASAKQMMSNIKTQLAKQNQNAGSADGRKEAASNQLSEMAYLQKIFRKAIEMNSTRDELAMNALSSAEILKAYKNKLTPDQRKLLGAQSRRLALMAEFEKNFRQGPNCAIVAGAAALAGSSVIDPDLLDASKTPEVFKSWYKSTLLHEVGHSLGLTHNFMGSTDKANFQFKKESSDNADRNYSSIMDYIPDHYMKYHGPGLYDVRALRVAYTGLVEVNPELKKYVQGDKLVIPENGVTIDLQNKSSNEQFQLEVKVEDLRKALLGDKSLWELNAQTLARLPLKHYNFCTDVHVGGDPACNRWDQGTDNLEIAKFYVQQYRNLYPVMNAKGNRLGIPGFGSYIGRIFTAFYGVRMMMDETFYLATQGLPQEVWLPSAMGAIQGLNLFSEIVNTPTAALPLSSLERFTIHENPMKNEKGEPVLKADGSPQTEKVLVEARSMSDLSTPGMPDQIDTRGYEYDKAIAMMMLTERGTGNYRYESISLRVSYAEFEKYLLGAEPASSLTLQTLKGVLGDNQLPMASNAAGNLVPLPGAYQPDVTEIVRYYATVSAGISLDADSLEDKYNFAALFRTGSSQRSLPGDRFAVTKLDTAIASPTSLKLWSLDNASVSGELVRTTAQKRALIENSTPLVAAINKMFLAVKAQDEKAMLEAQAEGVKLLTALNKNGLLISAEEAAQLNFGLILNFTVKFMIDNDGLADQIIDLWGSGQVTVEDLPQLLANNTKANNSLTKDIPYIGLAQKALLTVYAAGTDDISKAKTQIFGMYLNGDVLQSNHGIVVSNLSLLNKFLGFMYPELAKFN